MGNILVPLVAGVASNALISAVTPVQKVGKLDPMVMTPRAFYGSPLPLVYGAARIDGCPLIWAKPLRQTITKGKKAALKGIPGNPNYLGKGKGFGPRENIYSYYMTAAYLIGAPITGIYKIYANNVQIFNQDSERGSFANETFGYRLIQYQTGQINYVDAYNPANQHNFTDKASEYFANHSERFFGDQTSISSVISSVEGSNIPAFLNRSYITFQDYNIAQFNGNGFPKIDVEVYGKFGPQPLITDVLTDICLQCGLTTSQIDLSDIQGIGVLGGMVLQRTGETFADYIEELQKLFFIVIREENNKLIFLNKNRPSVTLNIGLSNLGSKVGTDKSGDLFKETILPIREMPSEIQISFKDQGNSGDQNTAYSRNPISQMQNPLSVSTRQWNNTATMAGITSRMMGEIIVQRNNLSNLSLLPCWFKQLHIGDVIGVNLGNRQMQIQITKLLLTKDYLCQIEGNNYRSINVPKITRYWVIVSFTNNDPNVKSSAGSSTSYVGQTLYTITSAPKYGSPANAQITLAAPIGPMLGTTQLVGNQTQQALFTSQVWGVTFGDGSFIPLSSPPRYNPATSQLLAALQIQQSYSTPPICTSPTYWYNHLSSGWPAYLGQDYAGFSNSFDLSTNVKIYTIVAEQVDPNTISNYSSHTGWIANPANPYTITQNFVNPTYDPQNYQINQATGQTTGNLNPVPAPIWNKQSQPAQGILTAYDINLANDSGSPIGPYFAVQNQLNFSGGSVFASTDGGQSFFVVTSITNGATVGNVVGTLSNNGTPSIIDTSTSFVVTSNQVINSCTTDTFLAGQNLILVGNEIIAFRDVTLLGSNQYKLSYLIRGCRGTEGYISTHSANENFLLLNGAVTQASFAQKNINKSYQFKIVPLGQSEPDITAVVSMTYTGNSCRPYSPSNFVVGNDGNGNLILNWTRRTYQKGDLVDFADIGWAPGEMSLYKITTPKGTTYNANNVSFTYTTTQMTTDGYTPTVGDTFTVRQYSNYVGLGYAATANYQNITIAPNPPDNTSGAYGGSNNTTGSSNLGYYQLFSITSNNQISFTLTYTSTAPSASEVFLNGVKAVYSIDYTISGNNFTWSGLSLTTNNTLEIYYS